MKVVIYEAIQVFVIVLGRDGYVSATLGMRAGSGEVYSFGQGQLGALGHGDLETNPTPRLVDSLWGLAVVQVSGERRPLRT